LVHAHEHEGFEEKNQYKLGIILILTAGYMVAEFFGGLYTNSLALMADAGHMLSDVAALGLSFFAIWLSLKPASPQRTYGFYRTEILAAFINGLALVGIAVFIIYEAYTRISAPPEVKAPVMVVIATGGLMINIIGAMLLHRSSKESLNIKGAFLHIIGDLLGSVGTIIAGLIIWIWGFYLADPIISFIIAALILFSAVRLVIEASNILLESTPSHISTEAIREAILELPFVDDVHDLHVWSISSKNIALSVHVVTDTSDSAKILCIIDDLIQEKFGIHHLTVQIEPPGFHEGVCSFR